MITQSTESSAIAYAGINSSEADQEAGKNEHLRSFRLGYPPRRRKDAKPEEVVSEEHKGVTEALGRASFFTPSTAAKKETYQRVLRLSRAGKDEGRRLGALATGLSPQGEVIIIDATKVNPGPDDLLARVTLGKGTEAADVDLVHVTVKEYRVAYCTDYEVYTVTLPLITGDRLPDPQLTFGLPHPDVFASVKARPKFRSIRFLTPNLLLLLVNQPNRKGAELLILEIPKFSSLGSIILRKRLHTAIKSATALSVAFLRAPQPTQPTQHVVAVAGQDNSITILSLDHPTSPPFASLTFNTHTFLPLVHSLQITSLAFSTFHLPVELSNPTPEFLKLASTSIASTLVIHTLPLIQFPPNSKSSSVLRHVLRPPGRSEAAQVTLTVLISAIAIALGAFFLQAFTEIRGGTPEYLGAKGWLSDRVHGYIARPYMFDDISSATPSLPPQPFEAATGSSEVGKHRPETATGPVEAATTTETFEAVTNTLQAAIETLQMEAASAETAAKEKPRLRDLLYQQRTCSPDKSSPDEPPSDTCINSANKVIVVSATAEDDDDETSFAANLHDSHHVSGAGAKGKKWEEMEEGEKERWRRRLVKAGEWAVEEGEAVLKGVLFSGWAGFVGEVVEGLAGD